MSIDKAVLEDSAIIASIIKESNISVAQKFGINENNNPKHPSFYTEDWARSDFQRGEEYFLYKSESLHIGCVAFEKASTNRGYLNRLSVLPAHQKIGVGESLVQHVFQYAESKDISEISIGIIAEHIVLKNWYLKLGFKENGIKVFDHLPFDVMFMVHSV